MPRSLNKVMLIGYIADEPTVRAFSTGNKVANLTLVTNEFSRNAETGQSEEIPEWHRLSCWGKIADIVESYVHKGSRVYAEGRLRTRSYTDKNGIKRYTTEINVDNMILLDSRRDAAGGDSYDAVANSGTNFGAANAANAAAIAGSMGGASAQDSGQRYGGNFGQPQPNQSYVTGYTSLSQNQPQQQQAGAAAASAPASSSQPPFAGSYSAYNQPQSQPHSAAPAPAPTQQPQQFGGYRNYQGGAASPAPAPAAAPNRANDMDDDVPF